LFDCFYSKYRWQVARDFLPIFTFIQAREYRTTVSTFDPKIAERFQDMFVAMAGLGGHFWTEHLSGASAPTRPRRAAA